MMKREVGDKAFPIWLLGDSNPKQWEDVLDYPLDPRHPIRHSIWTSVLDVIQDRVFRERRGRVDANSVYIRNAVENPDDKPRGGDRTWATVAESEVQHFRKLLTQYQPKLVLCFGAFAFEFARRACGEEPRKFGDWGAEELGMEFRERIGKFDVNAINALPLLHRSISGGKFMESHRDFCGSPGANYFDFVGNRIAQILLKHRNELPVWIE